MEYRLGIDLGTSSVAVVAISTQQDQRGQTELERVVWQRVHIFSEPLDNKKGTLVPKKQDRRIARQRRRQLQRRSRRIRKVAHLAPLLGLKPISQAEQRQFDKKTYQANGQKLPYLAYVRAKAATEKVALDELFRVFLKLTKKRGYSGGFKVKSNKDAGVVKTGADLLEDKLGDQTLGEFLFERLKQGLPTRLKVDHTYQSQPNLFALREHLEAEFEHLWQVQSQFHPVLNTRVNCPITQQEKPLKQLFFSAIFAQRPLKPFTDKIGQCDLEPTHARSPKAQMAAQAFRIEQMLANLRVGQGANAESLAAEQKIVIRELLNQKATVKFKQIYAALKKAGFPLPNGKRFSIHRAQKDELQGNTTLAGFRSLKLLKQWQALSEKHQVQVINFLSELGSPEQLDDKQWHTKFVTQASVDKEPAKQQSRVFEREMIDFINLMIDTKKFDRLSKMLHFEGGRSAYSIKALKALTDYMLQHQCDASKAIEKCYPTQIDSKTQRQDSLPRPEKTGNAVVDIALKQLHTVVNDCIDNLGCLPAEVIVETSREIKNSVSKRNEIEVRNNKQARYKQKIMEAILANNGVPMPSNILKYELWEQQNEKCPYCNNNISVEQVLSGAESNYEHIIPRSKSRIGLKRSEIILAHRDCNSLKGDDLPLIAFAGDEDRIRSIHNMADHLEKKKQKRKAQLLRLDDQVGLLTDESVSGFSDWQHHDTSWIAKLALQYLQHIVEKNKITATKGQVTAMMRRTLGLDTVIPEQRFVEGKAVFLERDKLLANDDFLRYKAFYEGHRWDGRPEDLPARLEKRKDHRHHLIDAFSIALCNRSFIQRVTKKHQQHYEAALAKGEKANQQFLLKSMRKMLGQELAYFKPREKAVGLIQSAHITHRPDHNLAGRFYQEAAYNRVVDEEQDKLRLTIRKPLTELAVKGNSEKTRKNLENIVSHQIKSIVLKAFEQRLQSGLKPEEIFQQPVMQDIYGDPRPILRVKVYYDKSAEKAKIIHSNEAKRKNYSGRRQQGYKYLIPDLYAYLSLKFSPDGEVDKSNSGLTTLADAMQGNSESAEQLEWRYYKGDTVVDTETNKRLLIHKFKAVSGGTVFMAPLTETRSFDQIKAVEGAIGVSLSKLKRYRPEHIV